MMTDIYLAIRRKNLLKPHVESEIGKCSICGEEVWIDVRTSEIAKDMQIVCLDCFREKLLGNIPVAEDRCPICGAKLIREEGCMKCPSCGWSACG